MSAPGLLRPPDWTRQALCQGLTTATLDPWYPDDDLRPAERDVQHAYARLLCAKCPVRHPCALEALHAGIGHGVWGGLTVADRRRIARRHGYPQPGSAQHGTRACYVAGCREPECREAHRRWAEGRRAAGAWRKKTATPPPSLLLVVGHGKHRAYPGQYVLFPDLFPASALLRPADTRSQTVAA